MFKLAPRDAAYGAHSCAFYYRAVFRQRGVR
jgi:hypothetical protein